MAIIRCVDVKKGETFYYTRVKGRHGITPDKSLAYTGFNVAGAVSEMTKLSEDALFSGLSMVVDMNDDEHMAHCTKDHFPAVRLRAELEYRVIKAVIAELRKDNFLLHSLWDGEERTRLASHEDRRALELAFNLDDSHLEFSKGSKVYWIHLVMGNSGWDVVSDYSYSNDEFAACIDRAVVPFQDRYS